MQQKLKILMIGPVQSGKTTLSNLISGAGEVGNSDYRPTKGCRILEFDVQDIEVGGGSGFTGVEVELWDISGDRSYETTWPVMQRATQGVVFVHNPGGGDQHARYLMSLYTQFVQQNGLKDSQCVVFCLRKPGSPSGSPTLGGPFSRIPQLDCDLEEGAGRVKEDFSTFLGTLVGQLAEATRHTENYIIG